jgi:hypothetical protein
VTARLLDEPSIEIARRLQQLFAERENPGLVQELIFTDLGVVLIDRLQGKMKILLGPAALLDGFTTTAATR